jgi:hypothetical protein
MIGVIFLSVNLEATDVLGNVLFAYFGAKLCRNHSRLKYVFAWIVFIVICVVYCMIL